MPINIDFLANVSRFLRGTQDVEGALEDVSGSLDNLARTADDSDIEGALRNGDRAAADLQRGLDKARTSGDKLERGFKDLADAARDTSKSGKKVGDDLEDGTRRAKEGFGEAKDEAASTAREMGASFSGDPLDALDALQETAANALAGFGPLGAAAGLAIAIGIGFAQAKLTEISDQINATAEEAGQLAIEWANATEEERVASLRDRWEELASTISDSREWWELWQADAVTSIEKVAGAADTNADVVARFYEAFNTEDPIARQRELESALDDLTGQLDDVNEALESYSYNGKNINTAALTEAEREHVASLREQREALEGLRPEIEKASTEQDKQNEITRALAKASGLTVEAYKKQKDAAADLAEVEDAYGSALEGLADPTATYNALLQKQQDKARETAQAVADSTDDQSDSWEDYVKDTKVSTQGLIDEWNRQADQAARFEDNLATIAAAGGDALARELAAKGPAVSGAVAEVIATASPAQQQAAIEAHARATGGEISSKIGAGIEGNRGAVQGAVDRTAASITPPRIGAHFTILEAQAAADSAARSIVPPIVTAVMRMSGPVEIYQ